MRKSKEQFIFWIFTVFFLGVGACSALEVNLPASVLQGRCFIVSVTSLEEEAATVKLKFMGQTIKCYREDNLFKGIVGIAPEQKPGTYPLSVFVVFGRSGSQEIRRQIKVVKAKFPLVSFRLKPAKKKLFIRDLIAREWARIERVLLAESEQKMWVGHFMLPAKGPISMVFGTIERINGKPTGRHRGLDIAVPVGTLVKASNSGRVVFAEHLKTFGGTIVLDHGQGIHTLYFHLSKFLAKAGQEVAKGDAIATSGNSGISSGPHLHWGMSVHNLRVDPVQWTKTAF